MLKDNKVIDIIQNSELCRVKNEIAMLSMNSIRMTPEITEDQNIPLGMTKIGGQPDLPASINWPSINGSYLSFIAQINLNEISMLQNVLPKNGLLSFFYDAFEQPWGFDPKDAGRWKVIYIEETHELERKATAAKLAEEGIFGTCKIRFSVQTTVPSWESIAIKQLNLNENENDLYIQLAEEVFEHNDSNGTIHRILGHPDQIQGEMKLECQLVSNGLYCGDLTGYQDPRKEILESGAESWKLLLQIDSEEDIGMMWGDVGRIFFWIHEDDLKRNDFNKVWLVLQCS
ncbi:YwqG family protein [Paenibacillus ihumii]|uniref:YwqG family protein n=1 Tax=Paenibacillus ihumii TaxID=687436 RepID=UPI0006D7690C|nr:YwqG family protein [Paenibacillus ihumii]